MDSLHRKGVFTNLKFVSKDLRDYLHNLQRNTFHNSLRNSREQYTPSLVVTCLPSGQISKSNIQRLFDVSSTPNKKPLKYRRRFEFQRFFDDRRNFDVDFTLNLTSKIPAGLRSIIATH